MLNALTHPSFVAKLVDKVISPSSRIAVPSVLEYRVGSKSLSHQFLGNSLVFGVSRFTLFTAMMAFAFPISDWVTTKT